MLTTPLLTRLDHIALVVRDMNAATERYAALFGREPVWRRLEGQDAACFQLGNIALDLVASDSEESGEGIRSIAFATPDIAKARHKLERRGIPSGDVQSSPSPRSSLAVAATHGVAIVLVESDVDATAISSKTDASSVTGLDHVVITTSHPDRAAALYGARLGLEMKLDRTNPDWGSRLMFFQCGDLIVEIAHSLKNADPTAPDAAWGLSWRVNDIAAANSRMAQAGFNVSDIRVGRKPGTKVFTVRDAPGAVPTLVIGRV